MRTKTLRKIRQILFATQKHIVHVKNINKTTIQKNVPFPYDKHLVILLQIIIE